MGTDMATGPEASADSAPVVIVGAGPTGLVTANLLGQAGIETLLLEREPDLSDEPRAVSFDDESLRCFQRAGLLPVLDGVLVPGTGTKYFGTGGRPLFYSRGPRTPPNGHPIKSPFQQPELERALRDALKNHSTVTVNFGTEVTGYSQDPLGVTVQAVRQGEPVTQRASYLLGCDGGRSSIRSLSGATLTGSSYQDKWLVLDTTENPFQYDFAVHHGDPVRPHVIISGQDGNCRYEFLLPPDFSGEASLAMAREFLAPYRQISEGQIKRARIYSFHALVADKWQQGRVFLLGDAAHMMPPFAGQGLNSGIRDADNLAWKIAAVVGGMFPAELLTTYQIERRPHAEAMVELSQRLGSVIMTRSRLKAALRDRVVAVMLRVPRTRRYLEAMRFKPLPRISAGFRFGRPNDPAGREVLGRLLPQPTVTRSDGTTVLLDEVLGDGFALLAVNPSNDELPSAILDRPVWQRLRPRLAGLRTGGSIQSVAGGPEIVTDADGLLAPLLGGLQDVMLLLRPDRFVAAVFTAGEAAAIESKLAHWLGLGDNPSPDGL
ncbi:bifunctional 3-(3-hydroxy-phenyl)propionate/3-hydroxycinnamic acid hydroxylase [Kribbella solani]|uniref:3-(3-hydroxy-phenyl)propionate hydroxylase n=2 Tax=Kribbella solani TaxID=236067 RepID=A0A841DL77_9ACTN|nr:bifunctional 3-(3-hydroxy-phenyl)propionate/3-hydroxycinnamic acid hydroxylase [Kribbella solani]MBB5977526.1 3-(3-hydroxy-phenyl)propionate hydroxylase [Kribbella solani]